MVLSDFPWAHWIMCPSPGPSLNRNNGASVAKGDWLVFIDDDCLADPDFLKNLHEIALTEDPDVIEGKIVCPDKRDNPFLVQPENLTGGCFWTGNLSFRRDRFVELGGFDTELGLAEDMEIASRIKANGWKTVFAGNAVVLHPAERMTLRQFWRRTLAVRWMLLYRHKIGEAVPQGASAWRVAFDICRYRLTFVLRLTWHLLRNKFPGAWRTRSFHVVWNWLNFPVLLPYLLFWEFKFREAMPLSNHSSSTVL